MALYRNRPIYSERAREKRAEPQNSSPRNLLVLSTAKREICRKTAPFTSRRVAAAVVGICTYAKETAARDRKLPAEARGHFHSRGNQEADLALSLSLTSALLSTCVCMSTDPRAYRAVGEISSRASVRQVRESPSFFRETLI